MRNMTIDKKCLNQKLPVYACNAIYIHLSFINNIFACDNPRVGALASRNLIRDLFNLRDKN